MKQRFSALCLVLVLLSGCASVSRNVTEDSLKKRVDGYMQATVSEKWEKVYTYFCSEHQAKESLEKFVNKPRNVKIKKYIIENSAILPSGNEADVKLKFEIEFQGYTFQDAPQTQRWIREKGDWYMNPPQKTNPFSPNQKK